MRDSYRRMAAAGSENSGRPPYFRDFINTDSLRGPSFNDYRKKIVGAVPDIKGLRRFDPLRNSTKKARRSEMGVKIREKVKGSDEWWLFINHLGYRKSKKVGEYNVAIEVARIIEGKLAAGDMSVFDEHKPKPQFKQVARRWRDELEVRNSTMDRYRSVMDERILPAIGGKFINKITRGDIRRILNKARSEGLSRSSLGLIRTVISGPMGIALDDEHILANPTDHILKRMKLERKRTKKVVPFTAEQANIFLDSCENHRPNYHTLFSFLLMTGVRVGEALAITWRDIDLKKETAEINKAFRKELTATKTGIPRNIDLSETIIEILRAHRLAQKKQAFKKGGAVPGLLFGRNNTDQYNHQNNVRNQLKWILRKAELPQSHRVHDCRHTYATLMLMDGTDIYYVSKQLGHSSISMTADIYGHWIPHSDRSHVNKLAQIIAGRTLDAPSKNKKT